MRVLPAITVAAGFAAASGGLQSSSALEDRSLVDDIWDEIEEATTCAGCQALLVVLKGLASLGDTIFVSTVTAVCKISGLVDDDVCEGAIEREGPILAHDLRHMDIGSKTSTLFCTTFLGLCDYPDVAAWDVPFPSEKPAGSRPEPSGETPLKIVQFSDTHVDPFYTEGANANCTKPICCRPYSEDDEPGNNDAPAGKNGDHNCDPPVTLEQSMFDAIAELVPDAAFAIFTGDIVDHAIWLTTDEQNTADINDMYSRAAGSIPLLYGTAGNHEMNPTNAFPTAAQNKDDADWLYTLLSTLWDPWIGAEASTEAAKFGAYSTKYPEGNLRLISLNTNLYYVQNYWLYQQTMEQDPSGQLAWLVSELQAAEEAGERAYIFGHMPMGVKDAFHDGSNYFDQIVRRYENTIAAMFFGHTHKDEFQVSYTDYGSRNAGTAMAVSYIMPSLTPTDGNPAFRVYEVDPVTFAVLDSVTYIADMDSGDFQSAGPTWKKYYSAKEVYGALLEPAVTDAAAELSPGFWHNVTEAFEADPEGALMGYVARKTRGYDPETCDGDCVASTVCMLRGGRSESNCYEPEPGQNIFKRGLDANGDKFPGHQHRDSCGVSVSRETFSAMVGRKDLIEHVMKRAVEENAPLRRME